MIDSFNGKYRFLSNFAPCKVTYEGMEYPSTESAYQAAKTTDTALRKQFHDCEKPGDAKKLGRKIVLRPDWEFIKLDVMEQLLRLKFNQPDFKRALLNTGDEELMEGNTWNDTFWGMCKGKGQNHLGKLLMKIRKDLHDR